MKSFRCGDIVPGCTAEMVAETDDDIVEQVVEHAGAEHPGVTFTPEVEQSVRAAIRPV